MFFLTPRYIKEAKHYRHALARVINYRRDVLRAKDLDELEGLLASLKKAIRSRDRGACAHRTRDGGRMSRCFWWRW